MTMKNYTLCNNAGNTDGNSASTILRLMLECGKWKLWKIFYFPLLSTKSLLLKYREFQIQCPFEHFKMKCNTKLHWTIFNQLNIPSLWHSEVCYLWRLRPQLNNILYSAVVLGTGLFSLIWVLSDCHRGCY